MRAPTALPAADDRKYRGVLYLLLGLLMLPSLITAQKINLTADADRTDVLIGEHVLINLKASADRKTRLVWPSLTDTFAMGLQILNIGSPDSTLSPDGIIHYSLNITVTAYDSGSYFLDNINVSYVTEGFGAGVEITADPLIINFGLMKLDENASLRDIKSNLNLPFSLIDLLPWLIIIIASALLGYIIYKMVRRRRKKTVAPEPVFVSKQKKHPWETAFEELEALQRSDLLSQSVRKPYYTRLSEIVRIYIRDGLGVNAPDLTTRMTLLGLSGHVLVSPEQKDKLSGILFLSDMVKFAKYNPSLQDSLRSMEEAKSFISGTAPDHLINENKEEA